MRVAILSNVNVDTIIKKISKEHEVFKSSGYGSWISELIDNKSNLYGYKPKSIFLLLDGEELFKDKNDIYKCKEEMLEYINYIETSIKINRDILYFASTIDIPYKKIQSIKEVRQEKLLEHMWYEKLNELNQKYDNFYIFDLKEIIENMGREKFYSFKLWYLASIKFSLSGESGIIEELNRCIKAYLGKRKKCLVLDLDNTLWGGIIGEDGLEGISLSEFKEGARYKDFQKRIKEMKNLGNILVVVSKNNYEDAIEVFRKHTHMILNEDDFASLKINWNVKADNIKLLSQELNIGLDSFVFIDDNPIERESVKSMHSEIIVPEFPKDTSELEKFIIEIYKNYFTTLKVLEEDRNKTNMYRENLNREIAKKSTTTLDDFLIKLQTKISIWKANEKDVSRISQLTQKTNQFNVTTKRYTESDIMNFINSKEYDVYVSSIKDKFGDNGIACVLIIRKNKDKTAYIDTFLLSCRVMGRNIEYEIINYIERKLYSQGFNKLYTQYTPTEKNKPVENLFEDMKYKLIEVIDNDNSKMYILNLNEEDRGIKKYSELIEI